MCILEFEGYYVECVMGNNVDIFLFLCGVDRVVSEVSFLRIIVFFV